MLQHVAVANSNVLDPWFRLLTWDGANLNLLASHFINRTAWGIGWSPTGPYIAFAHLLILPADGWTLLKWDGAAGFSVPATYDLEAHGFSFSPDGRNIAIAHANSPYFTLLKWDEVNLTNIADYTLLDEGNDADFSPNGKYIGVTHDGAPGFVLLKWDGANLTKVADYTLPVGAFGYGAECSFSPDGKYIAVTFRGTGGFVLLHWDETNLTKVGEYAFSGRVTNYGEGCSFSPDGKYIAVTHWYDSGFVLLGWDGINLSKVDDYTLPQDGFGNAYGNDCDFSDNGEYIAVAHDLPTGFTLLSWDGSNLTKADDYTLTRDGQSSQFRRVLLPPTGLLCCEIASTVDSETGECIPAEIHSFTPYFSAIFNSLEDDDTAIYYQIRINSVSDFTETVLWDSGKTSMSPVNKDERCANITYAGTQLELGVIYYWAIKFWNADDNDTPWSAAFCFRISSLGPQDLLCEQKQNPIDVRDPRPEFSAIHPLGY